MSTIEILNISGFTYPYDVYICDSYGTNCVFISTISTSVPPYVSITLPTQFNTAPSLIIKIIESNGCIRQRLVSRAGCNCPIGFNEFESECQQILECPVVSGYSGVSNYFVAGDTSYLYQIYGTFFYENITNKTLPLTFNNNLQYTGSLPYTGQTTGFNYNGQRCLLVDGDNFTPSLVSSFFGFNDVNISGTPLNIVVTATTTDNWSSLVSSSYGVMNNSGVQVSVGLRQWTGFYKCLEFDSDQEIFIYMSADDNFTLKIDGEYIVKRVNTLDVLDLNDGRGWDGFWDDTYGAVTLSIGHCIPLNISAGTHIFEFFFSDATVTPMNYTNGCIEIYTGVTINQITGLTLATKTSYLAFSSQDIRNTTQLTIGTPGDNYGIYCNSGILSNLCDTPYCLVENITPCCSEPTCGCSYTLPETSGFIYSLLYENFCNPVSSTTFSVDSLIVNGVEYISSAYTYTLDSSNVNWIPTTYTALTKSSTIISQTYSNFADFLNYVFTDLGLTGYSAHTATNKVFNGTGNYFDRVEGFYLTYPCYDLFKIDQTSTAGTPLEYRYTQSGLTDWYGVVYNDEYGISNCNCISVQNGVLNVNTL